MGVCFFFLFVRPSGRSDLGLPPFAMSGVAVPSVLHGGEGGAVLDAPRHVPDNVLVREAWALLCLIQIVDVSDWLFCKRWQKNEYVLWDGPR